MAADGMKGLREIKLEVGAGDAGTRLDAYIAGAIAEVSRNRAKALIVSRQVAVGGKTIEEPK